MSEIPAEQTQTNLPTPETTTESSISGVENLKNSVGNVLNSWKLKAGLAVAVLVGVLLFAFYWQHMIAVRVCSISAVESITELPPQIRDKSTLDRASAG